MQETAASSDRTSAHNGSSAVRLSVVIPAYNESTRLPAFLDSVLAWCGRHEPSFEVIVVDDGSSDGTVTVARQRDVRVISHERNAGKGAAVRTGMLAARGELRLFADADGATAMEELPSLLAADADIAIGSREGRDKRVDASALRRFLGRWFNRAVRMGAIKGIRDTQCGFKLFRPAAHGLFEIAQEDGFAFDVELLLLAQNKGLSIKEVFVNWTEMPGSKVSLMRDGIKMLKAVRRIKKRWKTGAYESAMMRVTPSNELAGSVDS
ncbi:MAG: glycosyltransferase family 2 protein [Planctomycetes bacterium]|nr:glycosyltransferase family 2 protein [Planctomycetota bacterium]